MLYIPQVLMKHVSQGKCVAFVGAGFSMPVGMPSWFQLLENILAGADDHIYGDADVELLRQMEEALKENDLLLAAAIARRIYGSAHLSQKIGECFSREIYNNADAARKEEMDERLTSLLKIPWSGVITTNYDDLIEMGLERFGQKHMWSVDTSNLGNSLARSRSQSCFFFKLHGTIQTENFVLGSEDYDQIYLANQKFVSYLTAVSLNYHIVFIGCSLEDEILRHRRKLVLDFGNIPEAYALLPKSRKNVAREPDLNEHAKIRCIFYPEKSHEALLYFLQKIQNATSSQETPNFLQSDLLGLDVSDRLEQIGSINREVYEFVTSCLEGGEVTHAELLIERARLSDSFSTPLSESEFFYRCLFLVSAGLFEYVKGDKENNLFRERR